MTVRQPWDDHGSGILGDGSTDAPYARGLDEHLTTVMAACPGSQPAAPEPTPLTVPEQPSPPAPAISHGDPNKGTFFASFWIGWGKSIGGTVLAMLIAADVGVNVAHNGAAVVSRVVPLMDDRPFYFDPLAVFHDLERVTR